MQSAAGRALRVHFGVQRRVVQHPLCSQRAAGRRWQALRFQLRLDVAAGRAPHRESGDRIHLGGQGAHRPLQGAGGPRRAGHRIGNGFKLADIQFEAATHSRFGNRVAAIRSEGNRPAVELGVFDVHTVA